LALPAHQVGLAIHRKWRLSGRRVALLALRWMLIATLHHHLLARTGGGSSARTTKLAEEEGLETLEKAATEESELSSQRAS